MLSRGWRRLIYLTFILLFLIVAPLLIFYASGYQYNWQKGILQQTGSFSIKPLPNTAAIYVDGVLQTGARSNNTLRLTNLLPGKYSVTLSQDGYYSWTKNLEVNSNLTTFVNQAVLFKTGEPKLIKAAKILQAIESPNHEELVYLTAGELTVTNLNNSQITSLGKAAVGWKIIGWSVSNDQILVKNGQNQFLVYHLALPTKPTNLSALAKKSLLTAKWSEENSYLVYSFTGMEVEQFNLITKEVKTLYRFPKITGQFYAQDFLTSGSWLYYIRNTSTDGFLERIDLSGLPTAEPEQLMSLPANDDFRFTKNQNGTVSLFDQTKQQLYLLSGDFKELILKAPAKNAVWSADETELLLYTDFEVWVYDTNTNQNNLITRYGETIFQAAWLPQTEYLLLSVNNTVKLLELDGRDQRNALDLLSSTDLKNSFSSPIGDIIYTAGKIKDQEGLFELKIQGQ